MESNPKPGRRRLVIAVAILVLLGALVALVQTIGARPDRPKQAIGLPQPDDQQPDLDIDSIPPPTSGPADPVVPSSATPPPTAVPTTTPKSTKTPATSDQAPVALRPPVSCPASGAPTAAPLPSVDAQAGQQWVTVGRLTGNCDRSSAAFHLRGIDTRLAWRSDADSFAVFVVDTAQGREGSAGFADAQCAGVCSEHQAIVPAAGDYTLEVQAGNGPWEVEIQEYRQL